MCVFIKFEVSEIMCTHCDRARSKTASMHNCMAGTKDHLVIGEFAKSQRKLVKKTGLHQATLVFAAQVLTPSKSHKSITFCLK
jgi:hypothetical protein